MSDQSIPLSTWYREMQDGIIWQKPDKNGPIPTWLTNFTARIVADVAEDDGIEVRRMFEIEAKLYGRPVRFTVPASQFGGMTWVLERLGASAIVYGFGLREHTRVAIQYLSGNVPEQRVYAHTGWRKFGDTWGYLHAEGAIGPSGPISGVKVFLPDALSRFVLPDPPIGEALCDAIRASLHVLDLAPDPVTVPVYSAIWRAVFGGADFGEHLTGRTGVGKTELAALAQQHWGAELVARNLPGSWSSTANANEGLAFAAKDALLTVDDFAPGGTPAHIQRLHRDADRVLRAQGNRAGRLRMRADATLRPSKPPRGLILSTGEDVPRGQSLRARFWVLEMSPDALDWEQLNLCQRDAANGLYAQALAGFIRWLAPTYEDIRRTLHGEIAKLRDEAVLSSGHRRTPEVVANLAVGFRYFLTFAQAVGALTPEEVKKLWERTWSALGEAAARQTQYLATAEPTQRFIELLLASIASGKAHIAGTNGSEPQTPQAWGWRRATVGTGDFERSEWRPMGDRIGWVDGSDLYLQPDAAYTVTQLLGRGTGEGLFVTSSTLKRRMRERGLLLSTDEGREVLTVRKVLEGKRRDVLHLSSDTLGSLSPSKPDQSDQKSDDPGCGQVIEVPQWDEHGNPTINTTTTTQAISGDS